MERRRDRRYGMGSRLSIAQHPRQSEAIDQNPAGQFGEASEMTRRNISIRNVGTYFKTGMVNWVAERRRQHKLRQLLRYCMLWRRKDALQKYKEYRNGL